jgi:hypothetical protein
MKFSPEFAFSLLILSMLVFSLSACGGQFTPAPVKTPTIPAALETPTSTSSSKTVTFTGMFNTITNGGPHYSLTTDKGQHVDLVLDVELMKPLGGPLEVDRKLVTVTGEIVNESPLTIRVISIKFAGNN